MNRRNFLKSAGALSWIAVGPELAFAAGSAPYDRLLVLVELKGGNDGLNTVVPYADREYYALRPRLAVPRDQVLKLDDRAGLHPSLQALMPLWGARELAIVQGVGYPQPNLSHFRSIEIWDTASDSAQYLDQGWLARVFSRNPVASDFAADGLVVGSQEMGPLSGGTTRALALADPQRFLRQADLVTDTGRSRNPALEHILKVERDIQQAASRLTVDIELKTTFPPGPFGNALKTAAQVIGGRGRVAAVKVSLNGFDTHSSQIATQSRLLQELAGGLTAFKAALVEVGKWDTTLILSYAEFGRRPKENQSGGTDHGTANAHFVLGGKVKGGLHGPPPALNRLDGNGNMAFAVDFRALYATVLERWWGLPSADILGGRYATLDVVKV
ncbi:MAG TPA: DUF1501 domain-containing protein [Burkholderiales bacterium]|nr:DUF1501 domain-containing protein [Burkholderiales bacterium]